MALFGITTIDRDDPSTLPRFNGGDVRIRRWRPGCQCFHPARCRLSTIDASPPTCTKIEAEPSKRRRDTRRRRLQRALRPIRSVRPCAADGA